MKRFLCYSLIGLSMLLTILLSGCNIEASDEVDTALNSSSTRASFTRTSRLWPKGQPINVCWSTSGFSTEKQWVRNAITDEYENHTALRFGDWGACRSGFRGIRISISDVGPHAKWIGQRELSAFLVLNFTFKNWGTACGSSEIYRKECIENVAVHEFGHAIGMAHEQNRADTSKNHACTDAPQGATGINNFTAWDSHSIMNYCNPTWNNDGQLSNMDIEAINYYYGGIRSIRDLGYGNLPRFLEDMNGDRNLDYCRFVGDKPNIFMACQYGHERGFESGATYNSIPGIDVGYNKLPQYLADVNGDRHLDYCRFVGDSPNIFLSCNLGGSTGFVSNQYTFNSARGIDQGYGGSMPRAITDVNGDGAADFCRVVGDSPNRFVSCTLSNGLNGFNGGSYRSIAGIDLGYNHLPRSFRDINNDGRSDFCRYVGDKPNIFLSCNTALSTGFSSNQYTINFSPDKDADYNK